MLWHLLPTHERHQVAEQWKAHVMDEYAGSMVIKEVMTVKGVTGNFAHRAMYW